MYVYLNGINIGQTTLPGLRIYFSDKQRVQDEIRGYLVYSNGIWSFVGVAQYASMGSVKKISKVALLLESPHKDEYDSSYNPLRPANGKTGNNINLKLQNRAPLINIIKTDFDYEIFLMNPVQFQASCYNEFSGLTGTALPNLIGNKVDRENTHQVFRILFNKKKGNQRQNFIFRLNTYGPNIIFNCCTSSMKPVVLTSIKADNILKYIPSCFDHHPSFWQ